MRSMPIRQDTYKTSSGAISRYSIFIVISTFILSACNSQSLSVNNNVQETQVTAALQSTETINPQKSAVSTNPTDQTTPTKTVVFVCPDKRGTVSRSYITTKELPGRLYFTIYLPPCYSTAVNYPVLYLLHGKSYQDDQWIRLGLPEIMDRRISAGDFPPFIVVMPYDPGWKDPNEGKYDKAIGESLVRWINSEYSAKKDREFRAIGGVSRGSAWAFKIGTKNPQLFSIIGIHSPSFFRADKKVMEEILEGSFDLQKTRIILDIGLQDSELNYTRRFEEFLTKYDIEHSWLVQDGSHSEAYWRQNLEYYLEEYSRDW